MLHIYLAHMDVLNIREWGFQYGAEQNQHVLETDIIT
jgi:hypothetical protein